jgi:SAM-dependent methyltransferase
MDIEISPTWTFVVSIVIMLLCMFYLWEIAKSYKKRTKLDLEGVEAFTNPGATLEEHFDGDCYDRFYSKVYDQLVQPTARAGLETQVVLEWVTGEKGKSKETLRIADIGCGTGLHVALFARQGVASVVGYDKSADMIAEARKRYPEDKFEVGDAAVASMASPGQFDVITMYYFTIYLTPNRSDVLKNIYTWLAPGGTFVCHIVNKLKFDPILESASPFVGFSVQKYADERVTKSAVTFEEFEYTGDFQLHGSRATYEEVFKFRDGRTRRHEQKVWMPNIDALVAEIESVGFKVAHHVDLTPIGYEYQYLFFFQKEEGAK